MSVLYFLSQDRLVKVKDLGLSLQGNGEDIPYFDMENATLDDIEKHIIAERLQRFNNDPHKSAKSLGLSRSSYYRRLDKHSFLKCF